SARPAPHEPPSTRPPPSCAPGSEPAEKPAGATPASPRGLCRLPGELATAAGHDGQVERATRSKAPAPEDLGLFESRGSVYGVESIPMPFMLQAEICSQRALRIPPS